MKMTELPNPYNRTLTEKIYYKGKFYGIKDSYAPYFYSTASQPISKTDYVDICERYMKFLMNKIQEGHEVTLPQRLGFMKIVGKKESISFDEEGKIKGLSPNWKKTKELWDSCSPCKEKKQLIYNENTHSSNIRYKYFWSKKTSYVSNMSLYSLIISRSNKRAVYKNIMEGKEYQEIFKKNQE